MRVMIRVLLAAALLVPLFAWADGRKLAIVVGVNTYRANSDLPSLKHAVADATQLSAALRESGFKVIEMTTDVAREEGMELFAPNLAYIRDQIDGVLGFPNLGEDDAVLITLHGHGVQYDLVDDRGGRTSKFYFCPADATVAGIKTANELTERNQLLPLAELYENLGNCRAATKLLIVDACRNDPTRSTIFKSTLASASLPKLPPPPGGMAAFFSCKANQRAIEDPDLKNGVFTHFLVKGLRGEADQPVLGKPGDGVITMSELTSYVANNTYAYVFDKYPGVKQSPDIKGEFDTNLPLARVVLSLEGTRAGEMRSFTDLGVKFCWCPAGSFRMGSPASDKEASDDEKPQVNVTLSRGYWLGQTEVTQGVWVSVMGTQPWVEHGEKDRFRTGVTYPAVYIDWEEANAFCRKLSERERGAGRLPSGWEYRLPSEAEWEYACRAGTESKYSYGNEAGNLGDYAWFNLNAWDLGEKYAHAVGIRKANPWKLHDLHGNVFEWCGDWYGEKLTGGRNPQGPSSSSYRVYRGGCWLSSALDCRSAFRYRHIPSLRYGNLGFRLALSPFGG